MTTNMDTAPQHRSLRVVLVFVAALEFALSGVQNIFTNYHRLTGFLHFAQTLSSIKCRRL